MTSFSKAKHLAGHLQNI